MHNRVCFSMRRNIFVCGTLTDSANSNLFDAISLHLDLWVSFFVSPLQAALSDRLVDCHFNRQRRMSWFYDEGIPIPIHIHTQLATVVSFFLLCAFDTLLFITQFHARSPFNCHNKIRFLQRQWYLATIAYKAWLCPRAIYTVELNA